MPDWKRIDDSQVTVNQTWSAFQTHRLIDNVLELGAQRFMTGSWAWNQLIHRKDINTIPSNNSGVDRRVRLGSSPLRPRCQIWQWAPHPLTTELTIDALYEVQTDPGVTAEWWVITRKGKSKLATLDLVSTVGVGEKLATWTLDLQEIREGGINPYQIYLLLVVTSETDDSLTPLTYDLPNTVPGERDYRRNASRSGVQYGSSYLDVTSTADFHDVELWEVIGTSVSAPGKGSAFELHWSFTDRPFETILRNDSMVVFYPEMLPFPYFDQLDAVVLQRMGELTLKSLHIRPTAFAPSGPLASPGAAKRALAGSRPAAGIEHVMLASQQDFLTYTQMPVMSWGPSMPGNVEWTETIFGALGVNRLKTNFTYWVDIGTTYKTVSVWRVGDDSLFAGDLPPSQRRTIEVLPMWLLLVLNEDISQQDIAVRLTLFTETMGTVDTVEFTTTFAGFTSKYVHFGWFGHGRRGDNNAEIRTGFSANGLWLLNEARPMLDESVFTEPQYINGDVVVLADNMWLRLEVKSGAAIPVVQQESMIFLDLGTTVRPAPTWVNDLKTIQTAVKTL